MASLLSVLRLIASRIAPFVWRFWLFLLPWQARWFMEGPLLGGWPWEQGRFSIYLSWVFTLLLFFCAVLAPRVVSFQSRKRFWTILGAGMFFLALFFTQAPLPTFAWILEVGSLCLATWSFQRLRISSILFGRWFVIALIPHALLALWQISFQHVFGSSWLGMASQDPSMPGVSVIAVEGKRWLRAYGGFPHPNIFGGWLALGSVIAVWLFLSGRTFWERFFPLVILPLFSIALVFTFGRTAWLALLFALFVFGWLVFVFHRVFFSRFCLAALLFFSVAFVVIMAWRPLVATRWLMTGRLEQQSFDQRFQGASFGQSLFFAHPFLGVGPRAAGFALAKIYPESGPVLPHSVVRLVFAEVGFLGFLGLCLMGFATSFWRLPSRRFLIAGAVLVVLAAFDHYLWSFWSGLSLAFLAYLWVFLPEERVLTR